MAVQSVKFTLNGQTYDLAYDSTNSCWKATISAPSATSWGANSDHKYHGTVVATDDAGNATTATIEDFAGLGLRVLEKTAPVSTITYPTAGAYITSSKPTITWTVTDSGSGVDLSTISIKIDNGAAITSGITTTAITNGYRCSYTPASALAEGSHSITVNASDNDGNAAAAKSATFTVDTVPPSLTVSAPAEGLITNNPTCTVSGTTNDATSSPVTIAVAVNGGTAVTPTVSAAGSWSTDVTLESGSNTITIVATDSAGKTTTITRTVTLDTGAPVITAVTLTPNPVDAGATYVITVTATD